MVNPKIIACINSCITYEQIQTCMNFINFYTDIEIQFKILGLIQAKTYELRNDDLREHMTWLRNK